MPDLETSLSYCTYCPKLCRHACPVALVDARETVTPQTLMATLSLLRSRRVDDPQQAAAMLYSCTGCLACTTVCLHHVMPGKHLLEARAEVRRAGWGHPALGRLAEEVRRAAVEMSRASRQAVASNRVRAEAQVAYFPGCEKPEASAISLALFDRIGAEYVGVADVSLGCGGYPLLAAGFNEEFRAHAEELAGQLQGYARVVVACPSCAWVLKTVYPAHGIEVRPEVLHLVEFLEQFAERLPVRKVRSEAFYHDPCYLGRHLGIYEPPRRLLRKAVSQVREFSRNRDMAECCGGGGVLPRTSPRLASAIAAHRRVEVLEAGVKLVVTSCPTCKRQLAGDGIEVRDLVEVLEEATRP